MPFLLRFNAFSEGHLDSLENPAYATQFRQPGRPAARPSHLPRHALVQEYQSAFGPGGTLPGGYSVSPQFSYFAPVGGFTFGGAAIFRASAIPRRPPPPRRTYYSAALVGARRFGANSLGFEFASLRGSGASRTALGSDLLVGGSDITQSRFTAGYTRSLNASTTLGAFYRYAFIHANDYDTLHVIDDRSAGLNSTLGNGHSSEAGIRLRGMVTPRLYYGATAAWLGVSLGNALARSESVASHGLDRAQRGSIALGLGYALTERTILTFDLAGGTARLSGALTEDATGALLQNGVDRSRFGSFHAAVQHELTRRIFLSASLLQMWQSHNLGLDLFPDSYGNRTLVDDSFFRISPTSPYGSRFSDYGVGWRFSRNVYAEYVYSTDYGVTSATHTLLLRWTFHPKGD